MRIPIGVPAAFAALVLGITAVRAGATASGGAAPAESKSEARAHAADILAHGPYQKDIPDLDEASSRAKPHSLSPAVEALVALGLKLALAAALVAIAIAAVRAFLNRRVRARPDVAQPSAGNPTPRRPAVLGATIADADRAAADGDFREAIHILLIVAIGACARMTSTTIRVSATSRELRASLPLAEALKARFAALVEAVERALFARRPVAAEDYATCRGFCEEILGGPRP